MGKLLGTHVDGPLADFTTGFMAALKDQGFADWSATSYQGLMAHLSRWLVQHEWRPCDLTSPRIEDFVAERRRLGYAKGRSTQGMVGVLVTYLRALGAIPAEEPIIPYTLQDYVVQVFTRYLSQQRGLADATITRYQAVVEKFLDDIEIQGEKPSFALIVRNEQVHQFLQAQMKSLQPGSFHNVVVALRSFFRFAFVQEWISQSMDAVLLPAPGWSDRTPLRSTVTAEDVTALVQSCDPTTVEGSRDLAVLLLLSRLGLRAGEVAQLVLEDIDWRQGMVHVRGKGRRHDELPLPSDVGSAIAAYCQQHRVAGDNRQVFLHLRAPHTALTTGGVSGIVIQACRRAGIPPFGAHRLRHQAASAMRQAGVPLWEIGQVLRHRRVVTTAHYAKPTVAETRVVARPWIGGEGR